MLKTAIIGGSGYTGGELLRLLLNHTEIEIAAITSEKSIGKPVSALFPNLKNMTDMVFEKNEPAIISKKLILYFSAFPTALQWILQRHI